MQPPPAIHCPRCRAANRAAAAFCYQCGHALRLTTRSMWVPNPTAPVAQVPSFGVIFQWVCKAIGALILLWLLIALGLQLLLGPLLAGINNP